MQGEPGSFPYYVSSKAHKHLDIVDYLRQYEAPKEKVLMGHDGEEQVVLRAAGNSKTKLESVTPLQWMGASIRIMHDLVLKGVLKQSDTNAYLEYMQKIGDLASKYTWSSILQYDREYRRWQAQSSCPWGADNIHLAEVHLDVRGKPPASQGTPRNSPQQQKQSASSTKLSRDKAPNKATDICRLYNLAKCTFGSNCRYMHKCLVPGCEATHTIMDHKSEPKNAQ